MRSEGGRLQSVEVLSMADICDSCAFEDACPSADFQPTGNNTCGDYKTMKKDGAVNGQTERETVRRSV